MRRIVVGVLTWIAFTAGWWWAARGDGRGALTGTAALLLSAVCAYAVMRAWQAHNKAIYRSRGARRSSARQPQAWDQDRLGRGLRFDQGLASAPEVVVTIAGGVKTYRATT